MRAGHDEASPRWLITGGSGFIGSALVNYVASRGHRVTILDKHPHPPAAQDASVVHGDVRDADAIAAAAAGHDVIVHLAADPGIAASLADPAGNAETNIMGTIHALEAARRNQIDRFVFASSGAAVGDAPPPINEDTLCHPSSPYGAGKLAGEAYCGAYRHSFGMQSVALRFGNVYGPGSADKGSVVATWIKHILAGEPWRIDGDGSQVRDFVFVGDLVEAIYQAATQPSVGPLYQIASATPTSISDLAGAVRAAFDRRGIEAPEPEGGPPRAGDIAESWADTSLARAELGWRPRVDLPSGLDQTIQWFLAHYERRPHTSR